MELFIQPLVELVGPVLSAIVGFVVGGAALAVMVVLRRVLAHVSRRTEITDPAGEIWSVRVVYGTRQPVTRRVAGMTPAARRRRRLSGVPDDGVSGDEVWHPTRLFESYEEASGLVAPLVLAAAVVIAVVFVIEIIIALPIALLFVSYSVLWRRWQVELVDPKGARSVHEARSLAEARTLAERSGEAIRSGSIREA